MGDNVKRICGVIGVAVLLGACAPRVPASNVTIGGDDFANFELNRARTEAQATRSGGLQLPAGQNAPVNSLPPSSTLAPAPVATQAIPSSDLAAAGIGAQPSGGLAPLGSQPSGGLAPLGSQPTGGLAPLDGPAQGNLAPLTAATPAAPLTTNNPGISDEQDFDAVAARETIQSDAERRAAQAAARQVVEPTALPTRPGETGPNIVAYALSAPNVKGQEWYSRSILSGQGRFERNCATYNSPDAAQRDFLARGGPERDPRGIDPDGDGFACGWDPAPFKLAAGN